MSINYKEIDLVLKELDLPGSRIQEIWQPTPPELILDLYKPQRSFKLYISLAPSYCRLHAFNGKIAKRSKPLRFAEFLKSNLRNGKIINAEQLGKERIIQFTVLKEQEEYNIWLRLWSGAANVIVTDQAGTILDALYRRPHKGEVTGGTFHPTDSIIQAKSKTGSIKEYSIRDLPGSGSFNEKLADYYFSLEKALSTETKTKTILKQLAVRENTLLTSLETLTKRKEEFSLCERWRELGELLKNNLYKIDPRAKWVSVEDFFHDNQMIDIELDPRLDATHNTELYFKRFKKEKASLVRLNEDIEVLQSELKKIQANQAAIIASEQTAGNNELSEPNLPLLKPAPLSKDKEQESIPGLVFFSDKYRLIVGRKAEENDQLLRKYTKGNDYWLHARDYPGAYVFITINKGKSVPLDIMLDAANLALFYSKGKKSAQGDVYYTQVKYLKRVKNAKLGTVIPTMEKNIYVKLDMQRINKLFKIKNGLDIPDEIHIL